MQKILISDSTIIIVECIILFIFVMNAFRLRGKNKKMAEMVSLQMNQIREENLDASLRNTMYIKQESMVSNANNPYDVAYHQEEKNIYEDHRERINIQIEEKGILSTKKYVVHVFDTIEIGSADSNAIVLNDLAISRHQIQFIKVEKHLYIKNLDCTNEVQLLRNKKRNMITEEAVCIKSSDIILLGNTSLKLTII